MALPNTNLNDAQYDALMSIDMTGQTDDETHYNTIRALENRGLIRSVAAARHGSFFRYGGEWRVSMLASSILHKDDADLAASIVRNCKREIDALVTLPTSILDRQSFYYISDKDLDFGISRLANARSLFETFSQMLADITHLGFEG